MAKGSKGSKSGKGIKAKIGEKRVRKGIGEVVKTSQGWKQVQSTQGKNKNLSGRNVNSGGMVKSPTKPQRSIDLKIRNSAGDFSGLAALPEKAYNQRRSQILRNINSPHNNSLDMAIRYPGKGGNISQIDKAVRRHRESLARKAEGYKPTPMAKSNTPAAKGVINNQTGKPRKERSDLSYEAEFWRKERGSK